METDDRTVDVVILTFGDYTRLEQTVRSVLEQEQKIGTVLLSDDGSGRPFPEEAVALLRTGDFALKLRQGDRNLGTVAHMNAAAGMLSGRCIKFLAAGDAFADSGSLKALAELMRQENAPVVTSDCVVCSADLRTRAYRFPGPGRARRLSDREKAFSALAAANTVSAAGTLFQRSFFSEHGGFDEDYRLLEDWPTWLKLARSGVQIPYLPRATVLYGHGGVSSAEGNAFRSERLKDDMRLCYEKEILPYVDSMPSRCRHEIYYHYSELIGLSPRRLWIEHPFLRTRDTVKRWLKRRMLRP